MKRVLKFTLFFWLALFMGCDVEIKETIRPFAIQSHLLDGSNRIDQVFAMEGNHLGVLVEQGQTRTSILYKYNSNLRLVDSLNFKGLRYTNPSVDNEGNIVFIGIDNTNWAYVAAVKISQELEVLDYRVINTMLPLVSGVKYNMNHIRTTSGQYVIAFTNSKVETYPYNHTILCGVVDPFKDKRPLWQHVPPLSGEWMQDIYASDDGGFYVTGYNQTTLEDNFIVKYGASGERLWETKFLLNYSNFGLLEEDDRIICSDFQYHYILNRSGDLLSEHEHFREGFASYPTPFPSNLLKRGANYFYVNDLRSVGGSSMELRKLDYNLNLVKSVNRGSWGTNIDANNNRFLVEMENGEMVVVALIESPSLTGNYWLMLKFDEELKMPGEE